MCHRSRFGFSVSSAVFLAAFAFSGAFLSTSPAWAQKFVIEAVAEKKIKQLPTGPLYWRIENYPSLDAAKAAAGPTGLAAEIAGKAWLFTLGPKGAASAGGKKVAEIGPVPPLAAPEYLLRINRGGGPPGAKTPIHTHPGSEAFYVLAGRLGQKTPHGVSYVEAGQSMNGHAADTPMEVFSAGTTDLEQIVMFLVDATRPFSSPAKLP
ncbi:MAG TPA: cupin domain-containing protein [Xanthobacteraceae bacterium]|nr:cupin domain-containing protein [Xanthobacteraceae bacterium]